MRRAVMALAVLAIFLVLSPSARAEDILEKSGAGELYSVLDKDTQALLDSAGAGEGTIAQPVSGEGMFRELSRMVREKLSAPLKALGALLAVCVMGRFCGCFEEGNLAGTARLTISAACGLVLASPVLGLLETCQRVTDSAAAFLGAAVPVYAGLLGASGNAAAGSGYSFVAMLAGEALPVLAGGFFLPLLRVYLALSVAASLSGSGLSRLTGALYSFCKWGMVMAVTVFAGILSLQTAVNAQVDAAANKAAKLALSTGVPIVGSALGDAAAAIQNSLNMVRSGAGAFGILAALCIFAPAVVECLLWAGVCMAAQTAAEVLEVPQAGAMAGAFGGAARMVLAVLASVCVVCLVTAGAIVFVRTGG